MRLEFHLTRDDWMAASWVHRRHARRTAARPNPLRSIYVAGCAATALGFLLYMRRLDGGGWLAPAALMAFGLFVPIPLILMANATDPDAWEDIDLLLVPTVWEADPDGLRITTERAAAGLQWEAFERWVEGTTEFLLYESRGVFRVVPKRAFAGESELNEFRRLLHENVHAPAATLPDRAHGFPVLPPKRDERR